MQDVERKVFRIQQQIHKNNQLPHKAQHFFKEANSFGVAR